MGALDEGGMLRLLWTYPEQFDEGRRLAAEFDLGVQVQGQGQSQLRELDEVLLLGTGGGSAAAGNLVASYLFGDLRVPFLVHQGYNIPRYVDEHTLCFVVTHSGQTEETLSAYQQAVDRRARVIAITSGGTLREWCRREQIPVLEVPGGLMPRVALGYLMIPILTLLDRLGLVAPKGRQIQEAVEVMAAMRSAIGPDAPAAVNEAKQTAARLVGKIPVIYGRSEFSEAVAARMKRQLAENAKLLSLANAVPALHHDEIVGWDSPPEVTKAFGLVLLRDADESEKVHRRMEITRGLLEPRAGSLSEVWARGQGRLARLLSLVYVCDYVSVYLALALGRDPTPVRIIDLFKREMSGK
jgi:glucose/mannose-6-phosphate isomerase